MMDLEAVNQFSKSLTEETNRLIKIRALATDKSAKLEDCVAAMMAEFGLAQGNDLGKVTAGLNGPGNSLNNSKQAKNQQEDKKICATGKANTPS